MIKIEKEILKSHYIVEEYIKLNSTSKGVCEKEAERSIFAGNRRVGLIIFCGNRG